MIRESEVIFILTREDIIAFAKGLDIPEDALTDDVFRKIKKGVGFGLDCWPQVVQTAILEAIARDYLDNRS